ncbi:MAG: DUF6265 family protein [Saprospiraceae bacterium]
MYNEEDYISNLFKDKEHLLEEKPSRRAWAKLEEKLDQDKIRSSRRIYRYISTAAAVIAIVAMISAIALFKNGNSLVADTQTIAMNEQQQGELAVTKDGSDWRKEYAPEALEEAEEAVIEQEEKSITTEKRIIADNSFSKEKERIQPSIQSNPESTPKPKVKQTSPRPTTAKPSLPPKVQKQPAANAGVSNPKPIVEAEKTEEYIAPDAALNMSDDVAYEEIKRKAEQEVKKEQANARASKKEYEVTKSKANRNKADDAKTKDDKTEIADFQWLTGAWSNQTNNGLSYEKWTKTDKSTLEAKGYLVQNSDTIFTESMKIKQIRNKVYYISNFGVDKSTTKFELISYKNGIATFENKKSKSPTRVIITKDGNNNFTITFQEAITPKLQYRNNIENARASRRMSRAYKK